MNELRDNQQHLFTNKQFFSNKDRGEISTFKLGGGWASNSVSYVLSWEHCKY